MTKMHLLRKKKFHNLNKFNFKKKAFKTRNSHNHNSLEKKNENKVSIVGGKGKSSTSAWCLPPSILGGQISLTNTP